MKENHEPKTTDTSGNKKEVNKAAMPGLAAKSKAIKKEDKENLKKDLFNAKDSHH